MNRCHINSRSEDYVTNFVNHSFDTFSNEYVIVPHTSSSPSLPSPAVHPSLPPSSPPFFCTSSNTSGTLPFTSHCNAPPAFNEVSRESAVNRLTPYPTSRVTSREPASQYIGLSRPAEQQTDPHGRAHQQTVPHHPSLPASLCPTTSLQRPLLMSRDEAAPSSRRPELCTTCERTAASIHIRSILLRRVTRPSLPCMNHSSRPKYTCRSR